ncbi:uncharacterized protein hoka isoform X2 [Bemisia tabaci]|uniref:uncharacterized protein hoka isoform X2 n=1 Tax=Bemisia tabaci TaxID=7038 RepID=UPI003B27D63E
MDKMRRFLVYFVIVTIIMAVMFTEVEGRRKILRGRKTITRTYYRKKFGNPFVGVIDNNRLRYVRCKRYCICRAKKIHFVRRCVYVQQSSGA